MLTLALTLCFALPIVQDAPEFSSFSPAEILTLADDFDIEDKSALDSFAEEVIQASPERTLYLGRVLARAGRADAGNALAVTSFESAVFQEAAFMVLSMRAYRGDEATFAPFAKLLLLPDSKGWAKAVRLVALQGSPLQRRELFRVLQSGSLDGEHQAVQSLLLMETGVELDDDQLELVEELAMSSHPLSEEARHHLVLQLEMDRLRGKLESQNKALTESLPEDHITSEDDLRLLAEVVAMVERLHMEGDRFTREELVAAAANGVLSRMDPHSTFFPGDEYAEFMFDMNPEYGGIGAYVNTRNGVFSIVRPIYSGPAYRAGLLSGDQILSVDGWSTLEQTNDDIIKRMKGQPGTEVVLEIHRRGWEEPREIPIERAQVQIPMLQVEHFPGDILYLELLSFSADVGERIADEIQRASQSGDLNGVVLDLRNNGGGYLSQAVSVCSAFLPTDSLIVTTKSRYEGSKEYRTESPPLISADLPVTILVNEYSASASEIVSGALSVHGRAKTVGWRTHGKGSVQNVLPMRALRDEPYRDENRNGFRDEWEKYKDENQNGEFDYGPRVKLTLAYYYLPDGSSIHNVRDREGRIVRPGGVEPDVRVEFPSSDPATWRELNRLVSDEVFRVYAQELFDKDPTLALELTTNDFHDLSRYLGWADFVTQCDTDLEELVLRQWARLRLRSIVSDDRGKVFAGNGIMGDFVEDPVLLEGIRQAFLANHLNMKDFAPYLAVMGTDSQ